MLPYRFLTLDVFTDRVFGGNPLAVLPDAAGLDAAAMQKVARELNLSETTFVFPPEDPSHAFRVRIFSPGREMPFAGHPTVGTAFALGATGAVSLTGDATRVVLGLNVGPVPVVIRSEEGSVRAAELSVARLPERCGPALGGEGGAALAGLKTSDVVAEPESWSCGLPFLFVPLRESGAVARARLDRVRWEELPGEERPAGLCVFCRDDQGVHARVFAPDVGIEEDPATGSAAAALAGMLAPRSGHRDGTVRWTVRQGLEIGRPSRIDVEVDLRGGEIEAVRVGGACVRVSEGTLHVPEDVSPLR